MKASYTGTTAIASVAPADWACATYDARGRLTQATVAAYGTEAGHIVVYAYAVGTNPFVSTVTEGTTTLATTVDLLGRAVSYTDAWAKTTTSAYDQAGRRTGTSGPAGAVHLTYDPAGRITAQSPPRAWKPPNDAGALPCGHAPVGVRRPVPGSWNRAAGDRRKPAGATSGEFATASRIVDSWRTRV